MWQAYTSFYVTIDSINVKCCTVFTITHYGYIGPTDVGVHWEVYTGSAINSRVMYGHNFNGIDS